MAEKDFAKTNTPLIITIGLVTTIVVFGLVVPGVRALWAAKVDAYDQENRVWVESRTLMMHEAKEHNDLTTEWIDEETGARHIPLTEAQQMIVERSTE